MKLLGFRKVSFIEITLFIEDLKVDHLFNNHSTIFNRKSSSRSNTYNWVLLDSIVSIMISKQTIENISQYLKVYITSNQKNNNPSSSIVTSSSSIDSNSISNNQFEIELNDVISKIIAGVYKTNQFIELLKSLQITSDNATISLCISNIFWLWGTQVYVSYVHM